jgi:uncharacterized protein (TIGR03086 family)
MTPSHRTIIYAVDEATAFRRAAERYVQLARQIDGAQWSASTPCAEWDVRTLVNHVAGEYLWVPELMTGKTVADVGGRLDGDLLGERPLEALARARDGALTAVEAPGALTRIVHLSFGDLPGAEYVKQMAVDSVIHSWDLAHAITADETLDPELVEFCYGELQKTADDWRSGGAFGPAKVPADDSNQARLLALTGR